MYFSLFIQFDDPYVSGDMAARMKTKQKTPASNYNLFSKFLETDLIPVILFYNCLRTGVQFILLSTYICAQSMSELRVYASNNKKRFFFEMLILVKINRHSRAEAYCRGMCSKLNHRAFILDSGLCILSPVLTVPV